MSSKALSDIATTRRIMKKLKVIQFLEQGMLGNGVSMSKKIGFSGKADRMMLSKYWESKFEVALALERGIDIYFF